MSELFHEADKAVRQLSDGQFFLEGDGSAVFLVKVTTGERVQLPPTHVYPIDHADRFARVPELSDRERQVFSSLGEGVGMAEIAQRLKVSIKTVETCRARLKKKLDINSRPRLVALAVEWHLMKPLPADGNGKA